MARIAFIGLGRMGQGMATRLVAAGHDVTVYNRTPGRAAALLRAGAREVDSPAEAADSADAGLVMVSDDVASREVWLGQHGALAPGTAPAAVRETRSPATSRARSRCWNRCRPSGCTSGASGQARRTSS